METITHTPDLDLAALRSRYVAMLEASEIPRPLQQRITVAAMIADLFTLAGVLVPAEIALALETAGGAV